MKITTMSFDLHRIIFAGIFAFSTQVFAQVPDENNTYKVGESFKECSNCPEMITIPKGSFMMGDIQGGGDPDEQFIRKITFKNDFAVGKYEITWNQWEECVADKACPKVPYLENSLWGKDTRPVHHTFHQQADMYINWLNKKTGSEYRLLSEAEFEYTARSGSQTKYYWGNDLGIDKANCKDCLSMWKRGTNPVGSFAPNAYGVFDMHGNLWEVVEDCYNPTYEGAPTDGSARVQKDCKVQAIRGGGWAEDGWNMRAANRRNTPSHDVDARNTLTFRVALSDLRRK